MMTRHNTQKIKVHNRSRGRVCITSAKLMQRNNVGSIERYHVRTSKSNERNNEKTLYFLDYLTSHPTVIVTYRRRNMVMNVHSNISYLVEPKARSRAGGRYVMSNNVVNPEDNGTVLNIAQIIKNTMSSAAEANIDASFINLQQAIPKRTRLLEIG